MAHTANGQPRAMLALLQVLQVQRPCCCLHSVQGSYEVDESLKGLTWADLKRFADKGPGGTGRGLEELHHHYCE